MSQYSNVRVSVQFKESTVFAGEDVECIVTFRNAAHVRSNQASQLSSRGATGVGSNQGHRKLPPAQIKRPSLPRHLSASTNHPTKAAREGISLSKSSPSTPTTLQPSTNSGPQNTTQTRKGHGKSLSILSLSSEAPATSDSSARRSRGQNRSSNQHGSRRASLTPQDESEIASNDPSSLPTPSISLHDASPPTRPKRSESLLSDRPPSPNSNKLLGSLQKDFKFPAEPHEQTAEDSQNGGSILSPQKKPSLRAEGSGQDSLKPIARLMGGTSASGTPRSSMELYSMSNHSDETLASEYPTAPLVRPDRSSRYRRSLKLPDVEEQAEPETLMMGYAQVMGAFTLDGSLVNQAPFEEVKRKGVVGGQGGGGVVGVESNKKRESGIFGAFGWTNIGESIGGLLGGGELSSIKEMRTIASSKAIPLISTPHSILFVDLKLAPGESKKYSYKFTLPRGLPPSHRGRAIKVTYNITIGIQRPGSSNEQRIRSIDIPFRVFGTVNARGDVLSHDLLTPHIYLRDSARTSVVDGPLPSKKSNDEADLPSFIGYVSALLDQQRHPQSGGGNGLLSPTMPNLVHMRRASSISEPTTSKEAIDLAIMRLNPQQANSSTKFSIARSKRPVATILLSRTAYRLGETISLIVDFTPMHPSTKQNLPSLISSTQNNSKNSSKSQEVKNDQPESVQVPVYAILVSLETHESVAAAISMRSPQSVVRATRKVHAQQAESCLFARRLTFNLAIPAGGTPGFETSGVGLKWSVKVEFVTPVLRADDPQDQAKKNRRRRRSKKEEKKGMMDDEEENEEEDEGEEDGDDDEYEEDEDEKLPKEREREWTELLEEVNADDRGQVLQGVESLPVESFEITVPVRVYGAVSGSKTDSDAYDLAV